MSEQQHTPGPWLIDVDNYHAGHIASVATADGPGPRFEVWSMNWPKQEQCEANARLIAAAPELKDALIELLAAELASYPSEAAGREAQDAWADRRAAARNNASAVIAKATGR